MALRLFGDGRVQPVVEIEAPDASDIPLTLIGAEDQTANLLEIKDNSDNIIFNVDPNGQVRIDGEPLLTNDQLIFFHRMFA